MAASQHAPKSLIGLWGVVAVGFFNVCGGAWGSEQVVSAGGPLLGLLGLLVFPLIWCIPVSFIVAELSAAFPEDGGYTVWVTEALGPFWGFQEGYWSWVSGVVDNAIYPVLGMDLALELYGGEDMDGTLRYLIRLAATTAMVVPNIVGITIVEKGLIAIGLLTTLPFLAFTVLGAPSMDWDNLGDMRPWGQIQWGTFASALFWNYNGFDGISTFAAEVRDPGRTYPRALVITVGLIVLTYLLPLAVAAGNNDPDWSTWDDGSFSKIADLSVGSWLGNWVVAAGIFGCIGMFVTELMVDSYQLMGMAQLGLAPAVFAQRHPKYDTPAHAVLASYVIIAFLVALDFETILAVDNVLSALSIVLILVAAYRLRKTRPEVARPFRIPGSDRVLLYLCVTPSIITAYMLYTACTESVTSFLVSGAAIAVGVAGFFEFRRRRRRTSTWDYDKATAVSAGYSPVASSPPSP